MKQVGFGINLIAYSGMTDLLRAMKCIANVYLIPVFYVDSCNISMRKRSTMGERVATFS
jgi:hypothetical protein